MHVYDITKGTSSFGLTTSNCSKQGRLSPRRNGEKMVRKLVPEIYSTRNRSVDTKSLFELIEHWESSRESCFEFIQSTLNVAKNSKKGYGATCHSFIASVSHLIPRQSMSAYTNTIEIPWYVLFSNTPLYQEYQELVFIQLYESVQGELHLGDL